jgi:hypothetical protein
VNFSQQQLMTNAIRTKTKVMRAGEKMKSKAISRLITTSNYSDFAGVAGFAGFAAESVL